MAITISLLMFTDSVFSAISPFLWLGDVVTRSSSILHFYAFSNSMFYVLNTFFACLLLFLIHNYGLS